MSLDEEDHQTRRRHRGVVVIRGLLTQSCPTLRDPMACSPPGSSVHEILQARILEWVAIFSSKESSRHRDRIHVSCVSCGVFTTEPSGNNQVPRGVTCILWLDAHRPQHTSAHPPPFSSHSFHTPSRLRPQHHGREAGSRPSSALCWTVEAQCVGDLPSITQASGSQGSQPPSGSSPWPSS